MTEFARADLQRFREAIARRLGLFHDDAKLGLLNDVLRNRVALTRSVDVSAYFDRLLGPRTGDDEFRVLATLLTINETYFFRNVEHLQVLRELALPARIRARGSDRRIRILSAGCSSGEEAYSIAITLKEAFPELNHWDVKILGLDLSPGALAKAAKGRYSRWSLRATPDETKARYFSPTGNEREVDLSPSILKLASFEEVNLTDREARPWQAIDFDVIFCRNVMMYFPPETMRAVVEKFERALVPGGYLFLGHAETLRGVSRSFHLCHSHQTFYYRLRASPDEPIDEASLGLPALLDSAAGDGIPEPRISAPTRSDLIGPDGWFGEIQRASDRITRLTEGRSLSADPEEQEATHADAAPAAKQWELGPILTALEQERFTEGLALLERLPREADDHPEVMLLKAVLLTNHGRLAESEQACQRLLSFDAFNAGAHYLLALCREHAADLGRAIDHDQAAIHLDPTFAMPQFHLGLIAKRSGDRQTAQRALSHARRLLEREDPVRLTLFGGGFPRQVLLTMCRTELQAVGGER